MTQQTWQERMAVLAARIVPASAPGLAVAVARGDGAPDYFVTGSDAAGQPLAAATLFPVASITKLLTALTVLRLAAAGKLALDDPLARHLPDAAAAQEGVTLRRLLCHTAGLPGDLPDGAAPYTPALDWPALRRGCLATALAYAPGTLVHYSNTGVGVLAAVIEQVTGQRFADAATELVLAPFGIEGYLGSEPPRRPAYLNVDYSQHAGTELEPYNSPFWRSLALPWGGLITTLAGALTLVRAFAGQPAGYLPPDLLADARRDQTDGLRGELMFFRWPRCAWGLGIELRGDKSPHYTPRRASPQSFGHPGASGCLAWVDPVADVAWVLHGIRRFDAWWQEWAGIGEAVVEYP